MNIADMNWLQVEEYLKYDDRAVIPLGSTEQHAYLSLCVDYILSSKLAQEAAQGESIPVFPGVPYGIAPYFQAYPGSITISPTTYFGFVQDIISSLYNQGFRRFVLINGHGGNTPVQAHLAHCLKEYHGAQIIFHNWWSSAKVMAAVKAISPIASHASWMENFPWTRLKDVVMPDEEKPMIDLHHVQQVSAQKARDIIGDGNYGGYYYRNDEDMLRIWNIALEEVKALYQHGWVE